MLRRIWFGALLCAIFVSGCQTVLPQKKAPLEEEGEVVLYLQPFAQEADRLRFKIESISLRRDDGSEFPLMLKLSEFKGREMTGQRLLGSARVPPGAYTGLTLKVKDAFIRTEDGEAALHVPDAPVRASFAFQVSRKKGYLLSLLFQPKESLKTGFSFSPVFSISIPPKPVVALTGYVTNQADNNVTVFDKKIGQAAAVIAMPGAPAGMALDKLRARVYVAVPDAETIAVIDVGIGEITDRMRLGIGDRPWELALTPDGNILLSANRGSNTVSVIDTRSLIESARVSVGNAPTSILIDTLGRRAYVVNNLSSTISVLDIANRALVTTIATDSGPVRAQFNLLGDTIYVIHEWSAYLTAIDARSLTIVKRMSVGMGMRSIKVDPNSGLVYLGKSRDIALGIYEPLSFVPVGYFQTGTEVGYLTIDGELNNLLMVTPDRQRLMIANIISRKTLSLLDVGDAPYWVTVMGER